jgi:hypothetical protein
MLPSALRIAGKEHPWRIGDWDCLTLGSNGQINGALGLGGVDFAGNGEVHHALTSRSARICNLLASH